MHLIKGAEISYETLIDDVHLVCFGCDWKDDFFAEFEQFTVQSKVGSYKELTKRLIQMGMPID
ncbi:MAG: hypothetical protein ACRC3H_00290 [Lachnospiraceae bacterium]